MEPKGKKFLKSKTKRRHLGYRVVKEERAAAQLSLATVFRGPLGSPKEELSFLPAFLQFSSSGSCFPSSRSSRSSRHNLGLQQELQLRETRMGALPRLDQALMGLADILQENRAQGFLVLRR